MPAEARPVVPEFPGYAYFVDLQAGPYFRNEATRERTAEEAGDKLAVAPDDRWAHVNLGRALLDSGDEAGARSEFVEALKSDPQFSQAYAGLGKVELLAGNWEEAFEAYSKARRSDQSSVEAVFGMGQAELGSCDLEQAAKWYKETLELEPGGSDPLVGLGVVKILQGETTDALRNLKEAVADGSSGTGAYHVMALAYLRDGDPAQAERCFRKALETRPADSRVRNALGHTCLRLGDTGGASAVFRGLVDADDSATRAVGYQNTGALKMRAWDVRGALDDWTKSSELDPGRQAVLVDLGQAHAALGDGAASARALGQAAYQEPYFWYLREWLARAMLESGDYAGAISYCDATIDMNPSAWISHLVRGIALADIGAVDESALEFEKAGALRPPVGLSASERALLGMSYARGKEYELALEEYRAAARAAPRYAPYRRLTGDALASLKRHEEALVRYNAAIELDPSDVKTYQAKADLLSFLGRRDEAVDVLERAVKANPDDVATAIMLAQYLMDGGDVDGALERLDAAREIAGSRAETLASVSVVRGRALEKRGDPAEAVAEYQKALGFDPARGDAWFYLSQAYERMGMAVEAEDAYAKAAELCPGNPAWKTLLEP
jgi:tetratricopeptide (TPR) repeat protein